MLTDKPIGKRTLGRLRCRRKDNIRMDLKEMSICGSGMIRPRIGIIGETL